MTWGVLTVGFEPVTKQLTTKRSSTIVYYFCIRWPKLIPDKSVHKIQTEKRKYSYTVYKSKSIDLSIVNEFCD